MTIHDLDKPQRRELDMQMQEPQNKIKFDPTINLGHVVTFIGFIITGTAMWQAMDKRVTILENSRAVQDETNKRHDSERAEIKKTIREDLHEINGKLDRIIESKR